MKKYWKVFALFIFILTSISSDLHATKRFWIAATAKSWATTSPKTNWAATSGGASNASIPGSSDTAVFDGNGTGNCILDVAVNVKRIQVEGGYTGTIGQTTNTITIGTSGANFSGGNFS